MGEKWSQNDATSLVPYLIRLAGEIRLEVVVVDCVLLVEGAILHRNWKGCNKVKPASNLNHSFIVTACKCMRFVHTR